MSTLYISEFADLPLSFQGVIQAPGAQRWVTDQTVAIGATSAPSAAFNADTTYVVLTADAPCSIAWTLAGAEVNAATTSNLLLPANTPRIFGVAADMIVSAIANS